MKRALPLLAVLIGGCAHQPAQVQVREVIREVAAPAPVTAPVVCVQPRAIPAEPKRVSGRFTGDARHDLAILATNSHDLRAWGQTLRRLLEKCVQPARSAPASSSSR